MVETVGYHRAVLHYLFQQQSLVGEYVSACIQHYAVGLEFVQVAQTVAHQPKHGIEPHQPGQQFYHPHINVVAALDVSRLMPYHYSFAV